MKRGLVPPVPFFIGGNLFLPVQFLDSNELLGPAEKFIHNVQKRQIRHYHKYLQPGSNEYCEEQRAG